MSEIKVYNLGVGDIFSKIPIKVIRDASALIDGTVEEVALTDNLIIITSFEMNMLKLMANRVMFEDGKFVRIIFGNAFVVRKDADGQYTSIEDSDIDAIETAIRPIVSYTYEKVSYIDKDMRIVIHEFKK